MKKTLLFVFALLFATAAMAQNRAVLLQESFNGNTLPDGWSISSNNSNWSVSATNNAGGAANEMKLDWNPQFNGTTRLVSPAVDLTGISSVVFSFKHALDNYSGSNTIGIATTSDGGTTWNQAWSQGYNTSSAWSVSQEVSTPDMGQANVQFCIFFNGNSYNINDWYFDDIMIFTLENLDLGLESINVPDFIASGEHLIGMSVFNYGATTVTSMRASYAVNGETVAIQDFDVNIPSLGTASVEFNVIHLFSPGSYMIDVTIEKVNGEDDDVADNNELSKSVSVAIAAATKTPMIEHFSSSTCGPCVSVNQQMLNFCNNNAGRFTYTKYQMNWPGSGDPYYTEEGGVRRNYYGVNAVPQCFLDGEDQGYAAITQAVFDEHAERAAFMDIRGYFTVDGSTVNVAVDVMPYIDANARIYVSVNEKETHNNVGTNGETSFHHVFMKMLPDAQGSTFSFTACELQHLEFTQNMSGTHVEEMDDLEVSIWVQEYATHEIFNSHFAYENIDYLPPVSNLALIEDETGSQNIMVASWDDPGVNTPHTYNIFVNGVLVEENYAETTYSFPAEIGVYYSVGVQVAYENDLTSVTCVIGKENTWSVGENEASICKVYPNPATSNVRIEAENSIESVKVYNVLGALVANVPANGTIANVDMSQYSNGVYVFNIRQSDGTVSNQRVVVSH
jgi:hypothetical protein